jgi:hypothetical protein
MAITEEFSAHMLINEGLVGGWLKWIRKFEYDERIEV